MSKTHKGWAIEKDFDWGSSFLGVYYFSCWNEVKPLELLGCRTMVFRTRRQAEEAKQGYLKGRGSRILRVKVTVEPLEESE